MNRTVIGLNLKFFIHSIVATLLMFTGLFCHMLVLMMAGKTFYQLHIVLQGLMKNLV